MKFILTTTKTPSPTMGKGAVLNNILVGYLAYKVVDDADDFCLHFIECVSSFLKEVAAQVRWSGFAAYLLKIS